MHRLIIASGPVIVENGKVLLDISGEDIFWKFCGGRVREDEALAETAVRRAKEELGIDIEITDPVPFVAYSSKEKGGVRHDVILVHFLASCSGDVTAGDGVKEWQWLPLESLENEDLAPNIIPALRHFGFRMK
jgi:8-oxo-dGTP diphosphatase